MENILGIPFKQKDISRSTYKNRSFSLTTTLHFCLLAGIVLIFILITVPSGSLFGSSTDWYCQHVTIADTMRKHFLKTGELFPDWIPLGSGVNFYALSYYGFLRPDVIISYFFPDIPVEIFIQGYAVIEWIAGTWIFYWWMQKKGKRPGLCLTGAFLYLTSNCMFQTHRQIMFVNYLPFLLLSLICLDSLKAKGTPKGFCFFPVSLPLSLCIFLMVIHSFYFFPACFVCCGLYCALSGSRPDKNLWITYFCSVFTGISLAMVHLLPTALTILENKKDVKSSPLWQLFTVNISLNTLLYSPYGCGLTLICLYCLFLSLYKKQSKKMAAVLILLLFSQFCCWLLNGTLYLRPKALIPFLPLILLLTVQTLEDLKRGILTHRPALVFFCALPVLTQAFALHSAQKPLLFIDLALLFLYAICAFTETPVLLTWVLPALLFLSTAQTENYASPDKTRSVFSEKEILDTCTDIDKRLDILASPMTNSNYLPARGLKRTTMYSSVSNSSYNHIFYDILKMPVSTRNRVTMNAHVNPFQEYLMGVRYLITDKDKLPEGYDPLLTKGTAVLAQNKNVLPSAYGSTALFSEKEFDALSYPQTLDTLTNRTIVPEISIGQASPYRSLMKEYPLPSGFLDRPSPDKEASVTYKLPAPLHHKILLLSFQVEYDGKKDIDITINGIRNRLSGSAAPYPNRNTHFTYMFSQNKPLKNLNIHFSKGNYKISCIQAYTLPVSAVKNPGIVPFSAEETNKKELLQGSICMPQDGYFVTSFPFSRGYRILVDHKLTKPQIVNKGFVGFPIKKGTHEILIEFHAPGKIAGLICSFCAAVFLLAKLSTLLLSSVLRFPQDLHNSSCEVRLP